MTRHKGKLKITAPYEITDIRILDPSYREIARGTHSLERELDPGIYRVQAQIPGSQEEKLVTVRSGKVKTLSADKFKLKFDLPISLETVYSKTSSPDRKKPVKNHNLPQFPRDNIAGGNNFSSFRAPHYAGLAAGAGSGFQYSVKTKAKNSKTLITLGKKATSRLLIFAQAKGKVRSDVPNFTLRGNSGEVNFPQFGKYNLEEGWLALTVNLEPGIYTLEQNVPELGKRGQILFAEEGWETQVLVPWQVVPNFADATILLCQLNRSLQQDPISSQTQAYERIKAALIGLSKGRLIIAKEDEDRFLNAELNNPMLELIGCYALLAQPEVDYSRLQKIAQHLLHRLPHSPDAQLIALLAEQKSKRSSELWEQIQQTLQEPPLLAVGMEHLMRIAKEEKELFAPDSFLGNIMSRLTIGSVWTRWVISEPVVPFSETISPEVQSYSLKTTTLDIPQKSSLQILVPSQEFKLPDEIIYQIPPLGGAASFPLKLNFNLAEEEFQAVIQATYKQVFGNRYLMESERLVDIESLLKSGSITLRQFVNLLAKSELYQRCFFSSSSQYRFIELNYKHLLGRAPYDQSEIVAHVEIYTSKGYEAEIDSYTNSQEYNDAFGDWIVPYYRGFWSIPGMKNAGFPRMFRVYRGFASSDFIQTDNASRLVTELAQNSVSSIVLPSSNQQNWTFQPSQSFQRYSPCQKIYRIEVSGMRSSRYHGVRRSNTEYLVSFDRLSNELQRIHSLGGKVISLTEKLPES